MVKRGPQRVPQDTFLINFAKRAKSQFVQKQRKVGSGLPGAKNHNLMLTSSQITNRDVNLKKLLGPLLMFVQAYFTTIKICESSV